MPHRRPHNKSRYGCDQCRKRRVKCDEQYPRCANCIARQEQCHFSQISPSTVLKIPQATPSPRNSIIQLHTSSKYVEPWQSRPIRQRELELMHQWCCYTYTCGGARWQRLFQEYVGKEAPKCDYLMASVLAVSSFHLAIEALNSNKNSETARAHVNIGLEYQNQALGGLRTALETITPDQSPPILFTSILVGLCTIISPLLPAGPADDTRTTAEAFLPWVSHYHSIESIKEATLTSLKNSSIGKYIDKDWQSVEFERPLCVSELRRLNKTVNTSAWKHQVYEKAVSKLEHVAQRDDDITEWLVEAGREFLDELNRREDLALAIYMHWGVLLDQRQDMWWAKFSGRRLVEELSVTLKEKGPEWATIAAWCREQVGLLPANDRNV